MWPGARGAPGWGGSRWADGQGGTERPQTGPRARLRSTCSAFLLTSFFATTSLKRCSWVCQRCRVRGYLTITLFKMCSASGGVYRSQE